MNGPERGKLFALCDCNSFYCSCERLFRPELRDKPVVVLSNNDGCIVALTPEAKTLGLIMGTPFFQVREQIERQGVAVFSSNYELYGDMSARVMATLAEHAPRIERYSIDEAFIELDGMQPGSLMNFGKGLRRTVRQWTGIPIGVGIAPTKTLAKIANNAAKRSGAGVCVLDPATTEGKELLARLPCEKIWGIARRLAWRLEDKLGVGGPPPPDPPAPPGRGGRLYATRGGRPAASLAAANRRAVRQHLGVVGERIVWELNGVSCLELEEIEDPRKNICCSRSFGEPVEDYESLRQAVATHATRAGEKLRRQGLAATSIAVFLMTNRFRPDRPQYNPQLGRELLIPTSFTPELIGEATEILRRIYRPGFRYVKAGVLCFGLVPDSEKQQHLFRGQTPEQAAKEKRLMVAVDALNLYYGRGTVKSASVGLGEKPWHMQRARKSPYYTTRVEDLPCVAL